MHKTIVFLVILVTLSSSKCSRDDLRIERQNYSGATLRIDGIFYNKPQKAHFFLYRNGIIYNGGAGFNGPIKNLLEFYRTYENYKNSYFLPYSWGVFRIDIDKIYIEKWVSGDAFGRYTTTKFDGVIINDTTPIVKSPCRSNWC